MEKINKIFLLLAGLTLSVPVEAWAQGTLYATSGGQTSFHSSTPAEDINAVNKKTQAILNTTSGEIAVLMNMRDFDFPNELMEEHFNENYMESAKYPKATFKGKLDQTVDVTKNGSHELTATGTFTVHGVSQPRTLKGTLMVKDGSLFLDSDFEVALADHKIEVPKIVFVKIAQIIKVKANYILTPYKK
ncbi:YceI family protein [Salmonirosea aquatica]|uniref:YceI family protein n=1 Tax=Salmonirosea aquatica TaxID=2654236 RepID=A0A7C9FCU6_9BACT|nr:YceI family protein [Cytophagaceae bacterium SJW1-29]